MPRDFALIRASLFHTPRNPFQVPDALVAEGDGAVLVRHGHLAATGPFPSVQAQFPEAEVFDYRPGVLLPGLVDLHAHFPQTRMIGTMAGSLLEWLRGRTFAEEAKLAETTTARRVARDFLAALARNGTTTALVFGSHFPAVQEAFFHEAECSCLRVASGLVFGDRYMPPALLLDAAQAHQAGADLGRRWHGRGRLRYAVSPRFALSCSEGMLEAAGDLLRGSEYLFQTHLNESTAEVEAVGAAFPWAQDYLGAYERFGLVGERSVFAHDVQASQGEIARLGESGAAVAHCPTSNAFLGSGLFPLREHLKRDVRLGLGSDVAGGTGFGILKEGLAAYAGQALQPDGVRLAPAHLLYLATLGGAEALGLEGEVGDLSPGRAADLCLLIPRPGGTLASVLAHADTAEEALGAIFTLAHESDVAATFVAGEPVYVDERLHGRNLPSCSSRNPPEQVERLASRPFSPLVYP